jgi:hypothetical protein
MKKIGYVTASPAEFIIHQRFGKMRHLERGGSLWKWPLLDHYYLVPATTNSISFAADQITAENQGVEVSGFAIWKINEPERTAANFDFADATTALAQISANLKDVVESAIRHQVAKMTMDDVLRKRGSIILQLKQELAYIAEQWGIAIETVEIKNVRIMSTQLFANMQAKFRDEVRLESETSALATEKQIAEQRYAQREQLALREQELHRRELERKTEMDRLAATAAADLETLKRVQRKEATIADSAAQIETASAETRKKKEVLRLEVQVVAAARKVQQARAVVETELKQHQAKIDEVNDTMVRRGIDTGNRADAALALVKQLPSIASSLNIKELNITEDAVAGAARALTAYLKKPTTA